MTQTGDFVFARQGRSARSAILLAVVYAAMLAAIYWLDAAWVLMALLALPSLPALWELFTNPSTGLRLTDSQLDWHSGRRTASLSLHEIDHMRFDTRWDLSVRVTAKLKGGKSVRLPYELLPPHRAFEAELNARDVRVERHHFMVF